MVGFVALRFLQKRSEKCSTTSLKAADRRVIVCKFFSRKALQTTDGWTRTSDILLHRQAL